MRTRRHAAPGGRALATGLTVSATFGIVAGFASHQPVPAGDAVSAADIAPVVTEPTTTTVAAPLVPPASTAPPRTTIVERVVHRTIEVDESGVPLAPPVAATPTPRGAAPSPAAAPTGGSDPAAPAPAPAATTPPPPPTAAPPPPPTTAKPTCSGSKC